MISTLNALELPTPISFDSPIPKKKMKYPILPHTPPHLPLHAKLLENYTMNKNQKKKRQPPPPPHAIIRFDKNHMRRKQSKRTYKTRTLLHNTTS